MAIFGGIEGGSSHSTCVLLDELGRTLATYVGKSTNPWLFSSDQVWADVIKDIVNKCKLAYIKSLASNINKPQNENCLNSEDILLESLGISMSGCESDHAIKLEKVLTSMNKTNNDNERIAQHIFINHDTDGAICTASDKGGIVLISGTGSAAQLFYPPQICKSINNKNNDNNIPNGDAFDAIGKSSDSIRFEMDKFRIGGWGYALGDEGSAYWISHKAIKIVYDHNDKFNISPYPIDYVEKCMKEYFKINHPDDMLHYFYKTFDKPFIAKFCMDIVKGAKQYKDPLCLHLFHWAGTDLGRHLIALLRKADMKKFSGYSEIKVICVGSMWNDWDILKASFMSVLKNFEQNELLEALPNYNVAAIDNIQDPSKGAQTHFRGMHLKFFLLTQTAAYGAAYCGALAKLRFKLPINYADNTKYIDEYCFKS